MIIFSFDTCFSMFVFGLEYLDSEDYELEEGESGALGLAFYIGPLRIVVSYVARSTL